MLLESIEKLGCETEVALLKIRRIGRSVHTRKIEYEIAVGAVSIQLFCGIFDIIFIDIINLDIGTGTILTIPNVFQVMHKSGSDHTLGACHEDIHTVVPLLILTPNELIDNVHIALDDANNLHGYGFIRIIRAGLAENAFVLHLDRHIGSI